MSDLETEKFRQIGIDLINEYRVRGGFKPIGWLAVMTPEASAFIRSIQLHEKTKKELESVKQELADFRQEFDAFKQKVSDAAEEATDIIDHWSGDRDGAKCLQDFIIPKPQPDPLVEIAEAWGLHNTVAKSWVEDLRANLDALGLEIREKNDD